MVLSESDTLLLIGGVVLVFVFMCAMGYKCWCLLRRDHFEDSAPVSISPRSARVVCGKKFRKCIADTAELPMADRHNARRKCRNELAKCQRRMESNRPGRRF